MKWRVEKKFSSVIRTDIPLGLGTTSVFVAILYESKRIPHQEEVCWFLNTLDAEYLCHGEIEDINNCLPFKGFLDRLVGRWT